MATFIRIALFIALILGLQACGNITPRGGAGYLGQPYYQQVYPATLVNGRMVVNTGAPMSAYAYNVGMAPNTYPAYIMPDGRWNIAGFVESNPPIIVDGSVPSTMGTMSGAIPAGMTPDRARQLLADLRAVTPNPCSGESNTKGTSVGVALGAAAGAVIGAVFSRNPGQGALRGAAIGGVLGAASGHSDVTMSCEAWSTREAELQTVVYAGEPRCRDALHQREVNGRLGTTKTRDCGTVEGKNFERIGEGKPKTAQAPAAHTAPPPPRRAPISTPPKLEEELPPK